MADVADPEAQGRLAGDAESGVKRNVIARSVATKQSRATKKGLDCFVARAPRNDGRRRVMRNDLDPLILDLLEWIGREPRSYTDVIEAWRTSCPRLTVWEDAMDRGFAAREHGGGREVTIRLTEAG